MSGPTPIRKLLDGEVEDPQALEIERLRTELRQAQRDASDARLEADRAREDANRALSMLRRQLNPLYRAMQAVFGELDAAGVVDEPMAAGEPPRPAATGAVDDRTRAVYESWKARLGPMAGKVIDALLVHGDMNTTQLSIAAQIHRTNVPKVIYKLNQAGLINKNGGRFSLKALSS